MGDISTSCTYREICNDLAAKCVVVKVPATSQHSDTILITLATYGISTFMGCITLLHGTAESIITLETTNATTTSVTSGVLTLTIGSSATDSKERTIIVWGL